MTAGVADQAGAYVLASRTAATRADQAGLYALASPIMETRAEQAGAYALASPRMASPVAQGGVYLLASGVPCGTRWTQIWTIARADGQIFRFTSLDRPLIWGGETYSACNSMSPSASESAAEAGAIGNMELTGLIAAGAISQHDLHAGLFDGARAEATLVPWEGRDTPKPLLSGTFGDVSYDRDGFKVELIGDGARMAQVPLVRPLQADCRHVFGDDWCGKDLAPLTVTGAVTSATGLRSFTDAGRGESAGYFSRGRVTFTSGLNSGITAEIKQHEAGGRFTLWPTVAYPILAGDEYAMTPGCTNLAAAAGGTNGCKAWGRYVSFGGAEWVPGADAARKTANVRSPG